MESERLIRGMGGKTPKIVRTGNVVEVPAGVQPKISVREVLGTGKNAPRKTGLTAGSLVPTPQSSVTPARLSWCGVTG